MTNRQTLLDWCDATLETARFKDYAPNGLQVEGRTGIRRILTAVTASRAAIDHAVATGADMLLVHHGMFWKSEPATITGWKKQRIAALLAHDINLAGYHLPLDAHPELGNNAQLAARCGWLPEYRFGDQDLLAAGRNGKRGQTLTGLADDIAAALGRRPTVAGDPERVLDKLVWCSGGAQGYFQAAIDHGADAYITGEISEAQYHLANETGTVFISAGHHATERYGIQALGSAITDTFGIEVSFFDEANPA